MCWERYVQQDSEVRKTTPQGLAVREHAEAQPPVLDADLLEAVELIVAAPPLVS